ncbi:MAG: hypothetical protein MUF07_14000 [Steroidobacteraceae bacterium]|jgi:hypothetical protein|nr:hypothetical protein [Steroidobacteraceae bacterium]
MVTKLDRPVRREVRIGQKPYVVTITPDGLRVAVKGRRKGQEALWEELVGEPDEPLVLPARGGAASRAEPAPMRGDARGNGADRLS